MQFCTVEVMIKTWQSQQQRAISNVDGLHAPSSNTCDVSFSISLFVAPLRSPSVEYYGIELQEVSRAVCTCIAKTPTRLSLYLLAVCVCDSTHVRPFSNNTYICMYVLYIYLNLLELHCFVIRVHIHRHVEQ